MAVRKKRLGDLLVESGVITEDIVDIALREKEEHQKLGDYLIQKGYITEQQLIEVLEIQLNIPRVSLYNYPFDEKLVTLIPKETAKKNTIIPLKKEAHKLFVAMADPMDFFLLNDLRLSTGFAIQPVIATKDEIKRAISKQYDTQQELVGKWLEDSQKKKHEEVIRIDEQDDSPIIKLVYSILQNAVEQQASDIHIDPHEKNLVVRFRIDGTLRNERVLPKELQSVILARIKIMANLDITEQRIPQDGRIRLLVELKQIDLRISTLPTIFGEKLVIRVLDRNHSIVELNQLGFSPTNHNTFMNFIEKPHGLVLITGPTGSGKSSTLYAALNKLNHEDVNIITVEDPVEYQFEGINQVQVNASVGMTFSTTLRSILRQDPNIIMIGEIRDRETAEIAIRSSLTGHLVFSTLHTNDSIGTLTRLMDMGVEPFLVASALNGVVSQRLCRRICKHCKEEREISVREQEIFKARGINIERVFYGKGCPVCQLTGYRGRLAIQEVLAISEEMRRIMVNNEPVSKLVEVAQSNKTTFLIDDGLQKVKEGLTTTEEILRITTVS
ncbi:GspE/PulE family protein [Bacillus sp. AFS017336]|uniref:GspE/PulE family protein n=1 Tax=Bacillus sp. AFS017336 TaxID=2033489 RepID=UPI000BF07DC4|nr:ATPase, T2SS/T4P/T4SS family [Bacillus sp. AFS017336]PEL13440.1 type II secretion system protein GspE [Bacillus sp. AFS017336]